MTYHHPPFPKIFKSLISLVFVLALWAPSSAEEINKTEIQDQASVYFNPIPHTAKEHELTGQKKWKYLLGKTLFFDPRLSVSQFLSCHSCHHIGLGGTDQQENSIGHGWAKGRRNAPTVFNSDINSTQFWDGRASSLAEQAESPLRESFEMNNSFERIIATLSSMKQYRDLFSKSYPDLDKPITVSTIGESLQFFQSTLRTPNSRFDRFISGDIDALADEEIEGLALFMDRNCASCHYGDTVGGKDFHRFGRLLDPKLGVRPDDDFGRYEITGIVPEKFVFRVAPLRNVALTRPYFHSGKVWSLDEAVEIMAHSQLGFSVEKTETRKITAFLRTLSGEQPHITIPVLPLADLKTPLPSPR